MFNSKENGFSLIELIVVLIITAILAQIGFVAFNLYSKRTKAFAAKTALLSIQKECQNNKALGTEEIFSTVQKSLTLFNNLPATLGVPLDLFATSIEPPLVISSFIS